MTLLQKPMSLVLIALALLSGAGPAEAGSVSHTAFQKIAFVEFGDAYYLAVLSTSESTDRHNYNPYNAELLFKGSRGDFTIENGQLAIFRPGDLRNWSTPSGEPLCRFSLVIDNSGSIDDESLDFVEEATSRFIDHLPSVCEVQVIRFSTEVQAKSPFTRDREAIKRFIRTRHERGRTALFDALDEAWKELTNSPRKAPLNFIVLFTDGRENASKRYNDADLFGRVMRQRQTANAIPVFVIGVSDKVDEATLKSLGLFFSVDRIRDLDIPFELISQAFENTWVFKIPHLSTIRDARRMFILKRNDRGVETVQDFTLGK